MSKFLNCLYRSSALRNPDEMMSIEVERPQVGVQHQIFLATDSNHWASDFFPTSPYLTRRLDLVLTLTAVFTTLQCSKRTLHPQGKMVTKETTQIPRKKEKNTTWHPGATSSYSNTAARLTETQTEFMLLQDFPAVFANPGSILGHL